MYEYGQILNSVTHAMISAIAFRQPILSKEGDPCDAKAPKEEYSEGMAPERSELNPKLFFAIFEMAVIAASY